MVAGFERCIVAGVEPVARAAAAGGPPIMQLDGRTGGVRNRATLSVVRSLADSD